MYAYKNTDTHIDGCTHVFHNMFYVLTHLCPCMSTYIYAYIHPFVCIHVCNMCMNVYTFIHGCLHTYMYPYT